MNLPDSIAASPGAFRRHAVFRAFAACAMSLLITACVPVAPYQREALTEPGMEAEAEADEEAFRSHVYDAREGAAGGHGSTGGGCGCN